MSKLPLVPPQNVTVPESATVHDALKVLDSNDARITFVTNESRQIIGAVVDGDVRRGLLQGVTTECPVKKIMRKDPFTMSHKATAQQLLEAMRTHDIRQIPLITDEGCLEGVVTYKSLVGLKHPKRDNPVVIMAGGKGRRLLPLTTDVPKPMVPLGGRPMLEWIISRLTHYGFHDVTLAVNYLGHMIEDYFGSGKGFDCEITYLREELFLGTAGALSLIDKKPALPMLVMNGDILTSVDFEAMLDQHDETGAIATVCARSHQTEVPFGVIKEENGKLIGMDEKPVYENLISAGMYALSPEVLDYIPKNKTSDMPGVLMKMVKDNKYVGVYSMNDEWLDVGRHDDLDKAKKNFVAAG